jgi:hypothetical protein
MEFPFVEVTFINYAIGKGKMAYTFFPVILLGTLVLGLRPLRHSFDF